MGLRTSMRLKPTERRVRQAAALPLGMLLFAACGGDGPTTTTPPPPPPPPARTVLLSPSFAANIVEIFERRGCMAVGCHGTGAGTLTLADTATSYANLVDVVGACNGMVRVIPGNADRSVLVMKAEGTQACGSQMPLGDLPLDSIDMANIRNWVATNAFNN